ncbi:MAG: TetR/AcrR family transcriptional regulator [Candidatus Galacturonibacter soehngenii]|nr:TetR/AcrR family transcriptional regulator [Candidatus Galacturonibacter soehngenii]
MQKGHPHPASTVSKDLLSRGLLSLLQKKPYQSITITELCKKSDIARRTFYRNFRCIDEVLEYYIEDIILEFEEEMKAHEKESYRSIITAYFTFWLRYADFLEILNKNNLTHLIFIQYIKCLLQMPYIANYKSDSPINEPIFSCKIAYSAGGLWSLLSYWCANGCTQTPTELADTILS